LSETTAGGGLLDCIRYNAGRVEDICRDDGGPAALPDPSRRAYQWLKLLSDQETLETHLATLRMAAETAGRLMRQAGGARKAGTRAGCIRTGSGRTDTRTGSGTGSGSRIAEFRVDFYNLAGLYRCKVRRGGILLTASEAFIGAPDEVIESLVCVAFPVRVAIRDRCRATVTEYAASEEFGEVVLGLELTAASPAAGAHGRHYDLEEIFGRVNAEYFGGRLDRPILTWNETITHRKLGHYQRSRDTVMVSITLDDPAVPPYVVDFVMYHELLHKQLGAKVVGGRRYVHTPEFRRAEKKFRRYREADDYLKHLGQHLFA